MSTKQLWLFPISSPVEVPVGSHPGAFGFQRKYDIHDGVDLYCPSGTEVKAVEDGIVFSIDNFTGSLVEQPWWHNTRSISVKGQSGIITYGEIREAAGLSIGQPITRGMRLGHVVPVLKKYKGRPMSMLHLNVVKSNTTQEEFRQKEWTLGTPQPEFLVDPTPFLQEAQREYTTPKVIITAGGTREYIDDVRVLTNISTGTLGAQLADYCIDRGWGVYYVVGKNCKYPKQFIDKNGGYLLEVDTASKAMDAIREAAPMAQVCIHAMAVSDFGIRRDTATKLSSGDIDGLLAHLKANMFMNPKIVNHIKEWNPNIFLVAFKFEVGKSKEQLRQLAIQLMARSKANAVFVNDKEMIKDHGCHCGYMVDCNGNIDDQLAMGIPDIISLLYRKSHLLEKANF